MAYYRVIASDLRTGVQIAELPVSSLSYGSVLNGAGELSATLPLPEGDPVAAATLVDAVDPVRRQIVVERDGAIVWCGVVWAAPYDDSARAIGVRAAETWSYYRRRVIGTTRNYRQADQFAIARQLLNDAHAISGGDIGVTVGAETSGVLRDRSYPSWEYKNLGEAVEELANVVGGFDFGIDATWTPAGELSKRFRLYARKGRRAAETGHVFEVGTNVVAWDWPLDGTRYANRVHNVGAGQDAATKRTTRTRTSEITAGYPLIETVLSNTDVSVVSTLNAQADKALASFARPVVVPAVTVRADLDPIFGAYQTGDACRFICQPGLSPRFPEGLDDYRRIVGWEVSVSDEGVDEVRLDLGPEDNA
jgi:hypothetical protein